MKIGSFSCFFVGVLRGMTVGEMEGRSARPMDAKTVERTGAAMSQRFDPYHTWLGIPDDEQPPNHYRLLGIPAFESDPDVIQNALDQRMTHLKACAVGPHTAYSQRLLSEVSKAGVCLLRPAERLAYDAGLRTALAAGQQNVPAPRIGLAPPVIAESPIVRAPSHETEGDPPVNCLNTVPEPSVAMRIRHGRGGKNGRKTSIVVPLIQWALAGVIGLAAGCFVVFLVNPKHPLIVSIAGTLHPVETPKGSVTISDDEAAADPPEQSDDVPPEPLPEPADPEPTRENLGTDVVTPPPPPEPDSESPIESPIETPPAPVLHRTVLDLTTRSTDEKLTEETSEGTPSVLVEEVTGLNTTYELQPADGRVTIGHPVNVALTQYPGIGIRLSLLRRGEKAVLNVAPEMDIGKSRPVEFTKQRVQRLCDDLKKDVKPLNQQLSLAKTEAVAIANWLKSPALKTGPSRDQKAQRLIALKNPIIPTLEQQMKYAQNRAEGLHRLFLLAEQIHGTAEICYFVQVEPEDQGTSAGR